MGTPLSEAKTVVATVSGDDLLKSLTLLSGQVVEVKTIVANIPGEVRNMQNDITALKIWKAKVTGALSLITFLLTSAIAALSIVFAVHMK